MIEKTIRILVHLNMNTINEIPACVQSKLTSFLCEFNICNFNH